MQAVQCDLHVFVFLFKCFHHGQRNSEQIREVMLLHDTVPDVKKKSILWKPVASDGKGSE